MSQDGVEAARVCSCLTMLFRNNAHAIVIDMTFHGHLCERLHISPCIIGYVCSTGPFTLLSNREVWRRGCETKMDASQQGRNTLVLHALERSRVDGHHLHCDGLLSRRRTRLCRSQHGINAYSLNRNSDSLLIVMNLLRRSLGEFCAQANASDELCCHSSSQATDM